MTGAGIPHATSKSKCTFCIVVGDDSFTQSVINVRQNGERFSNSYRHVRKSAILGGASGDSIVFGCLATTYTIVQLFFSYGNSDMIVFFSDVKSYF